MTSVKNKKGKACLLLEEFGIEEWVFFNALKGTSSAKRFDSEGFEDCKLAPSLCEM